MSKRRTLRQRLKADPCNQRTGKVKAWAKRRGLEAAISGTQWPERGTIGAIYYRRIWSHLYYRFYRKRHGRESQPEVRAATPVRRSSPFITLFLGRAFPHV